MAVPLLLGRQPFLRRKEKDMEEKHSAKKNIFLEIAIIVLILGISLLCYFCFFYSTDPGSYIIIKGGENEIGTYDLGTDRLILVEKLESGYSLTEIGEDYDASSFKPNYNLIKISDGTVSVIEADCPARGSTRCTNQGKKSYSGNAIICQENGVTVTIYGETEDNDLDFVSK